MQPADDLDVVADALADAPHPAQREVANPDEDAAARLAGVVGVEGRRGLGEAFYEAPLPVLSRLELALGGGGVRVDVEDAVEAEDRRTVGDQVRGVEVALRLGIRQTASLSLPRPDWTRS